jgi:hypothetical protein
MNGCSKLCTQRAIDAKSDRFFDAALRTFTHSSKQLLFIQTVVENLDNIQLSLLYFPFKIDGLTDFIGKDGIFFNSTGAQSLTNKKQSF